MRTVITADIPDHLLRGWLNREDIGYTDLAAAATIHLLDTVTSAIVTTLAGPDPSIHLDTETVLGQITIHVTTCAPARTEP